MYLNIGFVGYWVWLWSWLPARLGYWFRQGGKDTGCLFLGICIYCFVLYATDNTIYYPPCSRAHIGKADVVIGGYIGEQFCTALGVEAKMRVQVFKKAEANPSDVNSYGDTGIQQTYDALYARKDEFTALFFASDYYACLAINYFYDKGIRVPDEMSVVGFDDNIFARNIRPKLITTQYDTLQ